MRNRLFSFIGIILLFSSCDQYAPCERYYIPADFVGQVTVFYEQKNGSKVLNPEGCRMLSVSSDGKCVTAWPYDKSGKIIERGVTYRYFLVNGKDSSEEIFEFSNARFMQGDVADASKKYVSYPFGGVIDGKYASGFTVDRGINFYNKQPGH